MKKKGRNNMLKFLKLKEENKQLKERLVRVIKEKAVIEDKLDDLVGDIIELNGIIDTITDEYHKMELKLKGGVK